MRPVKELLLVELSRANTLGEFYLVLSALARFEELTEIEQKAQREHSPTMAPSNPPWPGQNQSGIRPAGNPTFDENNERMPWEGI